MSSINPKMWFQQSEDSGHPGAWFLAVLLAIVLSLVLFLALFYRKDPVRAVTNDAGGGGPFGLRISPLEGADFQVPVDDLWFPGEGQYLGRDGEKLPEEAGMGVLTSSRLQARFLELCSAYRRESMEDSIELHRPADRALISELFDGTQGYQEWSAFMGSVSGLEALVAYKRADHLTFITKFHPSGGVMPLVIDADGFFCASGEGDALEGELLRGFSTYPSGEVSWLEIVDLSNK